jgi:hypothetical protein
VEDDHVDRPGVEERQRLKLTGTNSSIGLIVLIPYAHPGAIQWIVARKTMIWPALTHERPLRAYAPRGRRKPATRSRACGLTPGAPCNERRHWHGKTGKRHEAMASGYPLLTIPYCLIPNPASRTTCVLPTWWLWRSGCTRSHSELGRETLQR